MLQVSECSSVRLTTDCWVPACNSTNAVCAQCNTYWPQSSATSSWASCCGNPRSKEQRGAHVGDDQGQHALHAQGGGPAIGAAAERECLDADGPARRHVARVPDTPRRHDAQEKRLRRVILRYLAVLQTHTQTKTFFARHGWFCAGLLGLTNAAGRTALLDEQ